MLAPLLHHRTVYCASSKSGKSLRLARFLSLPSDDEDAAPTTIEELTCPVASGSSVGSSVGQRRVDLRRSAGSVDDRQHLGGPREDAYGYAGCNALCGESAAPGVTLTENGDYKCRYSK